MKKIAFCILGLSVNALAAQTADQPLSTLSIGDAKPNVMFVIDDSGSMAWSFMPDSTSSNKGKPSYRNAQCNTVYYNPSTVYAAPVKADGSSMPNASFNNASYDGFDTGRRGGPSNKITYNLANQFFAYDKVGGGSNDNDSLQAAYYYNFKNGAPSKNDCDRASYNQLWEKKLINSAEQQNFANWFSYYRTRMLMMKSSVGIAFAPVGDRYRVGYSSINKLLRSNYDRNSFLNINTYDNSQKNNWYSLLYATPPVGGTPLKKALNTIGLIYSGKMPSSSVTDPMQYTCQQNFTILTTDGYWNKSGDEVNVGDTDAGADIPLPMRDPNRQANTLADVAMHYFKNDIRPSMENNTPGVEAFAGGAKGRQVMRTYTLGLGVDGTLNRKNYPDPLSGYVPWPRVVGDTDSTIDDLWHAAVNGGGQFFSAKDPSAVAAGLSSALSDIEAKTASVGSADVSNSFMSAADRSIYYSSFKTVVWSGNVVANTLNLKTGQPDPMPLWSAQDVLGAMNPDNRKIYTCSATACNSLTDFKTSNSALNSALSNGVARLNTNNGLSSEQQKNNTSGALINYLRGDQGNEFKPVALNPSSLYRIRNGRLGAIVHGGVSFVKKPNKSYTDAGYVDYVRSNTNRLGMVYAPANDGMLHAFRADTGAEEWAFIPPSVVPNLWQQADRSFTRDFKYSVDGAPTIADIKVGSNWKTVLIGGLRGGGGDFYALDITNPRVPQPLWSFSDARLGQTYGFPVVGKLNGQWKVLLSSGYDNSDGKGYVFVLNAGTGALEQTLSTSCVNSGTTAGGRCGIAKIGVLMERQNVDDSILMAYAGDLAGNLWRFKLGDGSSQAIKVAQTGTDALRQPITTAPVIVPHDVNSATPMHYLTFGTGRYLNQADMVSSDTQTFYGLIVNPASAIMDNSFAALRTSTALSPLVLEKTCDKTIKDNLGGSVGMIDTVDTGNLSDKCSSTSDYDTITLKRAANQVPAGDLLSCKQQLKGWRADMMFTKERLSNDPVVLAETARFSTSIPGGDVCTAGGVGRQYTLPLNISKDWLCSNPSTDQYLTVGKNQNDQMLEDPKQVPTIVTPTDDSKLVNPDGTLNNGPALLNPQLKGRRSSWTELVR